MRKFITTTFSLMAMMLVAMPAFAAEALSTGSGVAGFGAAVGMGLATFGGALSQGKTGAAAVEGIARNPNAAPKVQTPMIIALAMTESLVLFSFVIAFFLQGKV